MYIALFSSLLGLVFLYFGAEALVKGSSSLGLRLGLSPLVVGLTIVAFGTSMPELTVSMYAAYTGQTDIAVGNSTKSLTANEVELKTDQASAQAYFQSELGTFFPATYTTDLAATSDYDVVFYIGTDLRESSTGTSPTVTEADTAPPSTSTATPKAEPTE